MTITLPNVVAEVRARLDDPAARVRYCLGPLIGFGDDAGYLPHRAMIAAGRLLGISRKDVKRLLCRIERGENTLDNIFVGALPKIPSMECGFIYLARLRMFPFIVKVGFSRRPHERMEDLNRQTKCRHVIEQLRVGTMFDEAVEFLKRRAYSVSCSEYFFDPARQMREMPEFLGRGWTLDQWMRGRARTQAQVATDDTMSLSASVNMMIEEIEAIEGARP